MSKNIDFNTNIFSIFDKNASTTKDLNLLSESIDFNKEFAVGISFGDFIDAFDTPRNEEYFSYMQNLFKMYNDISLNFCDLNRGWLLEYSPLLISVLAVFCKDKADTFIDEIIIPFSSNLEAKYKLNVCTGIGLIATDAKQLHNSYTTSKYAYHLYFFHPQKLIDFKNIKGSYLLSQDDYDSYFEKAFNAIITRNEHALERIDDLVDIIGKIHYGNHLAACMRTMNMTGSLTSRLQKYKLLEGDFYYIQDALQEKVLNCKTFEELKGYVHSYYARFLPDIFRLERTGSKAIVEKVKTYINENFMDDLSIAKLSKVACVSTNYFSHMFKNEVGINYKDYVRGVRMEHALDLVLNTDLNLYKISEAVGYKNPRTFTDAFKQTYGQSPTHYKKGNQKNNSPGI